MDEKLNHIRTLLYIILGMLIAHVALGAEAKVSWDANTEDDLAGYSIYYGTSSGSYDNVVDVGNDTSYTVANLDSNTTYYFVVTATDLSGNESEFSEEVSIVISDSTEDSPVDSPTEEETEESIKNIAYNYKNPFNANAGTDIVFITEESGELSIDIYTVEGVLIKNLISNKAITKGTYKFRWDSTDNNGIKINLGVYLGKLRLNSKTIVIKMVIKS